VYKLQNIYIYILLPEDWKSSIVLPICKGKGDPMECGSDIGMKLLEHAIKVVERFFENRIRQQIDIDTDTDTDIY